MGTRVQVFMSHDLLRFDDTVAALARLKETQPAVSAVDGYWRAHEATSDEKRIDVWQVFGTALSGQVQRYHGPGSLRLQVAPGAACIAAAARWRGFLSIPPLRRIHLAAFRAIGRALGARALAICADSQCAVDDDFLAGAARCIERLRSIMGSPQPPVDDIDDTVVAQTERTVPRVWYLDDLDGTLRGDYTIEGDDPPWRPLRVFDDGEKVYLEFPPRLAASAIPPVFLIGADGSTSGFAKCRMRGNRLVVHGLFAAAELSHGGAEPRVLITRAEPWP